MTAMKRWICAGWLAGLGSAVALAVPTFLCVPQGNPCYPKCGGQVNISGATLFEPFFSVGASTNDHDDVDCDGQITGGGINDQLAPAWNNFADANYWWVVQYRGVGSGNGFAEFVQSQLTPDGAGGWWVPTTAPDTGWINRYHYAPGGTTPLTPDQMQLAVMDVPTTWFVTQPGTPAWNKAPTTPGYGANATKSWDKQQSNKLKGLCAPNTECLNTNLASPDARTVYDTPIAWVPIAIIANRGTGLQNVKASDLQTLFLTGRMPNGENLVAATRDSGSGTRNGAMNSIGVDPSWGRGDNLGVKTSETGTLTDPLGPNFQATNMGGSSRIEVAVQNSRLAVGYTGLMGAGRAAADAVAGLYELVNVMFDLDGGTSYVRPSLTGVIHNCAESTGWRLGGNETFASVGDPKDIGYPMPESPAKDYLNNITDSIAAFVTAPNDPSNYGTPAEYLATVFTLTGAIDCLPDPLNPSDFVPNTHLNLTLQNYTLVNNVLTVPSYGGVNAANKVPTRATSPQWSAASFSQYDCACEYPVDGQYSDGSVNGNYKNRFTGNYDITGGSLLNARNRIAGDFNGDGVRNINDVELMMEALNNPTAYVLAHSTAGDPVVPEIVGDFNGDGNFDCRDVRYFCDGLAINPTTGKLDRAAAFLRVDQKWAALTGNNNFFGTTLKNCAGQDLPWIPGASAADVAGSPPWPGAAPHGADCVVDCTDATYIAANYGHWSVKSEAVAIDLSCDLNGDLVIDASDLQVLDGWMGCSCIAPPVCRGDTNCDGQVNFGDIDYFVAAIPDNQAAWTALYATRHGGQQPPCVFANCDVTGDGHVNFSDIDPFVALIPTTCP